MKLIKHLEDSGNAERAIFQSHIGRKCEICKRIIQPRQEFIRESLEGEINHLDPTSYIDKHVKCGS
jgi:hypothetical protein